MHFIKICFLAQTIEIERNVCSCYLCNTLSLNNLADYCG